MYLIATEKLDTVDKTIEALSKSLESLDKNIGRKLDLVNKSNTELSLQVIPGMSQRITALENQGTHMYRVFPLSTTYFSKHSVKYLR